ncbi:MAG: sodium:solute symporter family protein [Candidatus Hydrogenedentes bacterium]|nr:sodium:solute symporter family protein [Candidatus Hydrogenedentota bacterium]
MIGTPLDIAVMATYFVAVIGFGVYFGRYSSTTKDFYLGGQRFAWWVIAFSATATTVGSYSFVKYSEAGFNYGISSSQTYLNDWFWMPVLLLVWLPIIYYQRIQSVPEFFERRFGPGARAAATIIILLYLIGYVGINLLTLGVAMQTMLGLPVLAGAAIACVAVTFYVFAGGQTSVIMTDLVQGITLLVVGLGVFLAGVLHVGGFVDFWALLPQSHRFIFSEFNSPDKFSFIGIYGQDGLANSGAFVLMNQGIIMRFLAMRSVKDGQKMAICWILVLSPLAAITVSGGGWVARALVENGEIEAKASDAFILASHFLCGPGVFGFVLAALMAALMSTADTLINASSAVFVNDIYKPYMKREAADRHYLRVARISSLSVAAIGLALVPLFQGDTVYQAHAKFTAAVTPPIVVAILFGILWKRFNTPAALAALLGGGALVFLSTIAPFDGLFLKPVSFGMGPDSYGFTRALFGLLASGVLGTIVTLSTRPQPAEAIAGLVAGTQTVAMERFKGGALNRREGKVVYLTVEADPALAGREDAQLSREHLDTLAAEPGDLLYICDRRWWLGGLHSIHLKAAEPGGADTVRMCPEAMAGAHLKNGDRVWIEKMF